MAEKPIIAIPKTPAACADLLYKTREQRLAVQKQVDELQTLENALKEYFVNSLPKGQTGVAGKLARVQTMNKIIPAVKDWDAFYAYVKKKGAFYLLQRRLSEGPILEIWADKKTVPGVEQFATVKVSCTKL